MRALSIRQPWAWAIVHACKDIENRDWRPANPGLRFRGEFLIHASAGMTEAEFEEAIETIAGIDAAALPFPSRRVIPRGGIVGIGEIVDVVRASSSPWFFGPIGLVIENVRPLPFHPLKGALGFFEVPWPLPSPLPDPPPQGGREEALLL